MEKEYIYCPICGSKLEKHEVECKIYDCSLEKTWYQDIFYCRKCDVEYE